MVDHAPFEVCAWTAALAAFAMTAVAVAGRRRAALRYAIVGSLAALAVALAAASGSGLIHVSTAIAADAPWSEHSDGPAPAGPTPFEEREIFVSEAVSALAATPGLAFAVRARLSEHESPPDRAHPLPIQ